MPRIVRTADITWTGNLARGEGKVSGGSGAVELLPYTLATRIGNPEGKTSPEELLAAAHAACFSMALSHTLSEAGNEPQRLSVAAAVEFGPTEGGFEVKSSHLKVRGVVPGVDDDAFQEAARGAADGCPISGALKGNVDISVEAELESS